jgi:hypothetical protein
MRVPLREGKAGKGAGRLRCGSAAAGEGAQGRGAFRCGRGSHPERLVSADSADGGAGEGWLPLPPGSGGVRCAYATAGDGQLPLPQGTGCPAAGDRS